MYFCFLVGDVFIFVILCKFKAFKLQFAIKKRESYYGGIYNFLSERKEKAPRPLRQR